MIKNATTSRHNLFSTSRQVNTTLVDMLHEVDRTYGKSTADISYLLPKSSDITAFELKGK